MASTQRIFNKLLVANRGEIAIRVFRAASELGIRTIALYTHEDRYSLHRYKADEAYEIGDRSEALKPYIDIDEILHVAKREQVDAIHPGYGFLSESVEFAARCREAGITFIGPEPEAMQMLGDKVKAKELAATLDIPIIESNKKQLTTVEDAQAEAKKIGLPVMLKAAAGGGGRGMRVVRDNSELKVAWSEARTEAGRAFGDDSLFIEKFIENPRHVEVQILGDKQGNLVHLFERDCSVQRRFQKVVEVAPASGLNQKIKEQLYEYALKLTKEVKYSNAGTVEFLVDKSDNIYFIEVNPRIQVEHTVTEEVTGIDLVRSQILIAAGHALSSGKIEIVSQEDIQCNGFSIQCRITTEDPRNNFVPDYGKVIAYRSPGGFRIRLDAGSAYSGVIISPFFDSLLVKVTGSGRSLNGAAERLTRALEEFRIRGVTTNIPFLLNVLSHPIFLQGNANVNFIAEHKELLEFKKGRDRATKALKFISDIIVNGNPHVPWKPDGSKFLEPVVPAYDPYIEPAPGTRQKLQSLGPEKFSEWLREEKVIHYTDTTMRDAHQSLLATRVRSRDILAIAESFAHHHPEVFSLEVWGGATFDVAMRFLTECPWERLRELRKRVPNILLQMLFRGSNAVGYTAYPDNLVEKFVEQSAEDGIDIFRIFDSMNWLEAMKVSIKAVCERTDSLAEVCICYSGDLANPNEDKYTLQYYLDLAKEIEDLGAHILAIKDMAGLLKPAAATILVEALRDKIKIPIHLHTHDTSSIQAATYLNAVDAGVDVIDVALSSMSGLTSQPNFNSLVAMLEGHERELKTDLKSLDEFSNYWEEVREYYAPFESELKAGTAEVYWHEIPGGQYSNLKPQARALGLEDKFETIKENYVAVDRLLGRLVKVTPSSKVVGDFALYLTSNNLTVDDVINRGAELSFPESLKSFFRGELGQPPGGFPEKIQKIVLGDEEPFTDRPNAYLEPINFEQELSEFKVKYPSMPDTANFLSFKLYPAVFDEYYNRIEKFGRVTIVPTAPFFYGMQPDQEIIFDIDNGKRIIVRFMYVAEPNEDGIRSVFFKLNGQTRVIEVLDQKIGSTVEKLRKVEGANDVGAPLQGKLSKLLVAVGDSVDAQAPLFVVEAMKMETTVNSPKAGTIAHIELSEGTMVTPDDLVVQFESE